jgi:hypothetical protein
VTAPGDTLSQAVSTQCSETELASLAENALAVIRETPLKNRLWRDPLNKSAREFLSLFDWLDLRECGHSSSGARLRTFATI